MVKLVLILVMGTAFAQGLASTSSQPPLLIEDTTAAPLDAGR
ncbi:MAG: hypothetical protein ACJ8FS_13925 [Sphingomicrobium sp.]